MDFNKDFNATTYKYNSNRNVVFSNRGMVATGNPMAAQAGIDILKKGGNAIDAAIATAVVLSVVEPTCNGVGGDGFALVWDGKKLHGMNASGKSPELITLEEIKSMGYKKIPTEGVIPITVPGQVGGWIELSKKFGKLEFKELFTSAIDYARNGFIVQPLVSKLWGREYDRFKNSIDDNTFLDEWFKVFAPNDMPLKAGELFKNPELAKSLEDIALTKGESFYNGVIAEKIDIFMKENKGYLRKKDLEKYKVQWVEPITTEFNNYTVAEIPPNGHGITVLMALNIFKNLSLDEDINSEESIHKQIESLKLAFSDVKEFIADKDHMRTDVSSLLSDDYSKTRASLINENALDPIYGDPEKGGTVYLATADKFGNMVSYIQSNYTQFGSGVVIPGTGITMHNRGANFSLDSESDNSLAPNKKPYHTIIPGFLLKDKKAIGPFGVMGAFMQPQGHFQVLLGTLVEGLNPQDALNKPRWQWVGDKNIEVENSFDKEVVKALIKRGHHVTVKEDNTSFGRGEIIWRNKDDVFCGGCEPRTDASIAIW